MNRLTEKYSGTHVCYKDGHRNTVLCSEMTVPQIRECMEKLVAYEDTGLEPEELQEYLRRHNFKELHDHISELLDLKGQGKLIKLPCKVGDTVYKLEDYGEWQGHKVSIPIKCQVELIFLGDDNKVYCDLVSVDDLLQTGTKFEEISLNEVFLTREEAERHWRAND